MSSTSSRQSSYPIESQFLQRWSQRALSAEPIPDEDLFTAFEAARWSPSASNAQPWRFVYAKRETPPWNGFLQLLNERNRSWAQRASALVVLLSKKVRDAPEGPRPLRSHSLDAGAAWSAFALQARALGWSTRAMAGFDLEAARAHLQVPEHYAIEVIVAIGRPADKSVLPADLQGAEQPNDRLPLNALVAEGEFKFA